MARLNPPGPVLVESTVGFLDSLGTSAASRDHARAQEMLTRIIEVSPTSSRALEAAGRWDGLSWQAFSDSHCISMPSADPRALRAIVLTSGRLQAQFAAQGVFLRGAITIGPFYHDGSIVFGNALVRAHELEQRSARGPRVICDPTISTLVREHCSGQEAVVPIALDRDGHMLFVDFLQLCDTDERCAIRHAIEAECRMLVEARGSDVSQAQVTAEKLRWLVDYFNWRIEPSAPIEMPDSSFVEMSSYPAWHTDGPGINEFDVL